MRTLSLATIQQAHALALSQKLGEYHDYTVYLQPNLYTVKKGHKLALVFNTYDPSDLTVEHPYEVTFKTDSIQAAIPIVEKTRAQKAAYVPSATDTDYANLPEIEGAALVAPEVHYKEEYRLPSPEHLVQPSQTLPEKDEQMQTGSARQEQPSSCTSCILWTSICFTRIGRSS